MDLVTLTAKETQELLAYYESKKRKLSFELASIELSIQELKSKYPTLEDPAPDAVSSANNDVPRVLHKLAPQASVELLTQQQSTEKKAKKRSDGYRLNEVDLLLLDKINAAEELINRKDLERMVGDWSKEHKPSWSDDQVYTKVSRTLFKLSQKKKVGKIQGRGKRNFFYGPIEWFYKNSGELKKKYQLENAE